MRRCAEPNANPEPAMVARSSFNRATDGVDAVGQSIETCTDPCSDLTTPIVVDMERGCSIGSVQCDDRYPRRCA